MTTARVVWMGKNQAIRLPKEFHFKGTEIEIFRRGQDVILREKERTLERAFFLLADMPEDFEPRARRKDKPQRRKGISQPKSN